MGKIWYPQDAQDYGLTREQYFATIWFIRDYDNMKEEAQNLLDQSPINDGQPKGNNTSDPTAAAAERRERVLRNIKCVDDALLTVPEEYRRAVFRNVAYQVPNYKLAPTALISDTALRYWRVKFIFEVARNRERAEWRSY